MQAFAKKDYKSAKINFEKCSAEESVCLNNLGVIYQLGLGIPIDLAKATDYYKQASDKGLAIGMTNYANMLFSTAYAAANTNETNFKALNLYIDAAKKGSPKAMGFVAYSSTLNGIGSAPVTLPSQDTLINYAKISSMRGDSLGQLALGNMYRKGIGVDKDSSQGETNLQLAYSKKQKGALGNLYLLYNEDLNDQVQAKKYKELIINSKSFAEIIAVQNNYCPYSTTDFLLDTFNQGKKKECLEWTKEAAMTGNVRYAERYGTFLFRGYGTKVNKFEGAAWIVSAMIRGDTISKGLYEKHKGDYSPEEINKIEQRAKEINSMFVKK
jgi:hypothetical protein